MPSKAEQERNNKPRLTVVDFSEIEPFLQQQLKHFLMWDSCARNHRGARE